MYRVLDGLRQTLSCCTLDTTNYQQNYTENQHTYREIKQSIHGLRISVIQPNNPGNAVQSVSLAISGDQCAG